MPSHSETKAASKWKILRNAIRKSTFPTAKTSAEASEHSFRGFRLLQSTKSRWYPIHYVSVNSVTKIHEDFEHYRKLDDVEYIELSASAEWKPQFEQILGELYSEKYVLISVRSRRQRRQSKYEEYHTALIKLLHPKSAKQHDSKADLEHFQRVIYTIPEMQEVLVKERLASSRINLKELISHDINEGVDNTGNVRIWPAEEVLVHLLAKTPEILENKAVIELGAGMSGLAGLVASVCYSASKVMLTDGNKQAVENLKACIKENVAAGYLHGAIDAKVLRWDRSFSKQAFVQDFGSEYDLILASDCLFFEEFHLDLIHTIDCLLKATGLCLLLQPRRGKTLANFLTMVQDLQPQWQIHLEEDYDSVITQMHNSFLLDAAYTPDIHFPVLLTIRKSIFQVFKPKA